MLKLGAPLPNAGIHSFHHALWHPTKSAVIYIWNHIFYVCFQFLDAVEIIVVHKSFEMAPQKKSDGMRSGDLVGHSPCEIHHSLNNFRVIPCLFL